MINPYYNKNDIKIYNMDSLEYMQNAGVKTFDLVLTDPPYGLGMGGREYLGAGNKYNRFFTKTRWDNEIPKKDYFDEIFRISKNQIIWGGNYFIDYLYNTKCMLVWYKKAGLPTNSFADCELAWTSYNRTAMIFNSRWSGYIRDSKEKKLAHPTQKALDVMTWCLKEFSNKNDIILDPFCGTGTTLVAAKKLGLEAIGVEINSKYCDMAVERLEATMVMYELF